MFFNNKFNTFFGLNLTLVYTFPMCMAWRFHFPIRNYDFKGSPTEPVLSRSSRQRLGHLQSHFDGCWHVCLSQLVNCRSQFLLDRLGRCLKLFVSTESTSCHEFASQFGLDILYMQKTPKTIANTVYLNEAPTGHSSPA